MKIRTTLIPLLHMIRHSSRLSVIVTFMLITIGSFTATISAQSPAEVSALLGAHRYEEALPALEQMVRKAPKNATYQYQYGYALYQLKRYGEAISPLTAAFRGPKEGRYILSECLYMSYRFVEAAQAIDAYKASYGRTKIDVHEQQRIARLQARISRAIRMIENSRMITVIDSIVVDSASMLSTLRLSPEAGQIIPSTALVAQSAPSHSTAHLNALKDRAIVSLASADQDLDLAALFRMGDQWGELNPLLLLNTPADEAFPFLRQDGRTLLFARSEQQGQDIDGDGLGGYDIYMTRMAADGSYLKPTLLGMPFNSPYNDYLIAYDEDAGVGFLVSDRFQKEGKVCIYTFVLDDEAGSIPSDDEAIRCTLASLRSIVATQDQEADYSNLRMRLNVQAAAQPKEIRIAEFSFVVGDKIYSQWTDFRSVEARNLYRQMVEMTKNLADAEQRLERMRRIYRTASESNRKALTSDILQIEERIQASSARIQSLAIQARRAEIAMMRH